MATVITVDGHESTAHPADGKVFTLEELQSYVGGYIQSISLPNGTSMYVNEEGLLERLAPNEKASEIAAPHYVVGNVIICTDAETGADKREEPEPAEYVLRVTEEDVGVLVKWLDGLAGCDQLQRRITDLRTAIAAGIARRV